jgi:hypothetical protein
MLGYKNATFSLGINLDNLKEKLETVNSFSYVEDFANLNDDNDKSAFYIYNTNSLAQTQSGIAYYNTSTNS